MKTLNTKSKLTAIVALVVIAALCAVLRIEQRAQAQDQAPPTNERISFGMVGITAGQTMRISVADTSMPNDPNLPPGPSRVVLNFRNSNGQLVRNRNDEVIRKVVDLERGDSTFLDLNYDELASGPSRFQTRAVATILTPLPIPDRIVTTVEVINNANGRTAFAISALPAVQRIPLPVPD